MRVKGVLGGLALMLGLTMPVAAAPPDIAATAHPQAGRSMDRSAMQGHRHFGGWQRHMRHGHPRRGRSVIGFALRHRLLTVTAAALLFTGAIILATRIGKEFMPPLNEGDVMYMPITDPAISVDEALRILSKEDKILKSFPEVEWSVGKAGRADTSTDPAPVNMNETIVHLKPTEQWRAGMTREKLISEMNEKLTMPGVTRKEVSGKDVTSAPPL